MEVLKTAGPATGQTWIDRRNTLPDPLYKGQVRAWHVGIKDEDEGIAPHEMTIDARQFMAHPTLYSHWQPLASAPGTMAQAPMPDYGSLSPEDILLRANDFWKQVLTDDERNAIELMNIALDNEDQSNIDLGDLCCYQVPVLIDGLRRLARRNQALLGAMETIADTILGAAGHE